MVHMLRPGGFLVLTVPAFMCLWDHHDEINGHFRRYTARDLRERLAGLGQTVELRYVFPSLFFGKLVFRWFNRLARPQVQHHVPPTAINRLLATWCCWEDRLLSVFRVPFGNSLLAVIRKVAN